MLGLLLAGIGLYIIGSIMEAAEHSHRRHLDELEAKLSPQDANAVLQYRCFGKPLPEHLKAFK